MKDSTVQPIVCLLLVLCIFSSSNAGRLQELDPARVVAVVDGESVTYEQVKVTQESARVLFEISAGHGPRTREELAKVEELRKDEELNWLAARIRAKAHAKALVELGVEVSDEEVAARWREMTGGIDIDQSLERQKKEKIAPLLQAVRAVYEEGEDPDEVYARLLANRISRQEWLVHLSYYKTEGKRQILIDALAETAEDWREPQQGVRDFVVSEKLNAAVDRQIASADARFADFLEVLDGSKSVEEPLEDIRHFVESRRAAWWLERYERLDVRIIEPRFEGVLDRISLGR